MSQETTEEIQGEQGLGASSEQRDFKSYILPQLAGFILQTSAMEIKALYSQGVLAGMTTEAGHCRVDLDSVLTLYQEWFGEEFDNRIFVGLDQAADIMGLAHTTMYHHLTHGNFPTRLVRGHPRVDLRVLLEERRKPRPFFDFWHSKNDDRLAAHRQQKRLPAGA